MIEPWLRRHSTLYRLISERGTVPRLVPPPPENVPCLPGVRHRTGTLWTAHGAYALYCDGTQERLTRE